MSFLPRNCSPLGAERYGRGYFFPMAAPPPPARPPGPVRPEPAVKRTVVFIDGQNLFHAVKSAFGYPYPN